MSSTRAERAAKRAEVVAKRAEASSEASRPWLLDLCCCEGVSAVGYQRAGFNVYGVDKLERMGWRYPGRFWAGDAVDFLAEHHDRFHAVHASPPCQHASAGTRAQ